MVRDVDTDLAEQALCIDEIMRGVDTDPEV
jgi:hypothetical protein